MDDLTLAGPDAGTAQDTVNDRVTPPLIDGEPVPGAPVQTADAPPASEPKPEDQASPETKAEDAPKSDDTADKAKEDPEANADGEAEKPKSRGDKRKEALQGQIDQLTAQKRALERETQSLINKYQSTAARMQERSKQNIDSMDFESAEQARLNGTLDQRSLEDAQVEAKALSDRNFEVRQSIFETKVEAAKERIPDIGEALQTFSTLPVSEYAADIIAESDKAPEIAYYLAKNPATAHQLHQLPPHMQGVEIARIEGRLSAAPPVRKTSTAPPPPQHVSAANAPTGKSYSEMSMSEYAEQRKKEMSGA